MQGSGRGFRACLKKSHNLTSASLEEVAQSSQTTQEEWAITLAPPHPPQLRGTLEYDPNTPSHANQLGFRLVSSITSVLLVCQLVRRVEPADARKPYPKSAVIAINPAQ